MTRTEWQRVKKVSAEALQMPVAERDEYIVRACGGDPELEREARSLVTSAELASDLFEQHSLATQPTLTAGLQLGPYEIVDLLGTGAMGEVYRARDARIGRDVAVKVLPVVFAADPDRIRRFDQEARSAGVLNHPNVLTIYDVGSYAGAPYVVSELLEGETLRQRLGQPLPIDDAVDFARQIAEGLAAAHEKGIVHRDLKPENLFVTREGRLKILDFGLAKLVSDVGDLGRDGTTPGTVLGTVGYMAPEQVRGGPVDHRSDLFALGSIVYELLSGKRAFEGASAVETMSAILTSEPPKLSRVRADIPGHLEQLVERSLAKRPEHRIQTAREFVAAIGGPEKSGVRRAVAGNIRRSASISRMVLAVVALAVAGLGAAFFAGWNRRPSIERDSVVVGDIVNTTTDSVFDGAIKQALLIQLEPSPFLAIVSDSTVRQTLRLMNRSADEHLTPEVAREICQREGAKATVGGSIAQMGSRYVINLTAADCITGDAFAREQEEADQKENVLLALARASSRLRGKLGESLSSVQRYDAPVEHVTTTSLEALKSLSLAVNARARGADDQAVTFLNRAIELDPDFPAAHVRLSAIYSVAGELELAARHAKHAYEHRSKTGERERLTIEHAYYKRVTGELEKAVLTLTTWRQLYPRDFDPPLQLSGIHSQTGEYQMAADEAREAVRLNAPAAQSAAALGRAYLGLNRFDDTAALNKASPPSVPQRSLQYGLDFIRGDEAAMEGDVAPYKGTLGEPYIRVWYSLGLAARGRYRESREQFRLTQEAALRYGLREVAATTVALEAVSEAMAGHADIARQRAEASVKGFFGRNSAGIAATALAMAGATDEAAQLEARLAESYPSDTLVNELYRPCVRALIARRQGRPGEGLEVLKRAAPYELGWTSYYLPSYIRGVLYLDAHDPRNARREFQNILDHQGVMPGLPQFVFAYRDLGRAALLDGDTATATGAYDRFATLWKNADPGLPLLRTVRAEREHLTPAPRF